jgi:hypothetical protein
LTCAPVVGCKRCGGARRIVEGECCALAYNEDAEWFDDEDDEFQFDPEGGNKWFEDALVAGLKEAEIMRRGCVKRRNDEDDKGIQDETTKGTEQKEQNKKYKH